MSDTLVVEVEQIDIVLTDSGDVVVSESTPDAAVITSATQGPAGPPGPDMVEGEGNPSGTPDFGTLYRNTLTGDVWDYINGLGWRRLASTYDIDYHAGVAVDPHGDRAYADALVARELDLTTGEAAFPRNDVGSATVATTSGFLRLGYFTAQRSETCTRIQMWSGGTAAGATPTLVRVGIWTAGADGSLISLVGATPNDTTLLSAQNTEYVKALSSSFDKVSGQRYAIGLLVVTGATAPTMTGSVFGAQNAISAVSPVLCGTMSGLSDLPSSASAGSISAGLNRAFIIVKP